MEGVDNCFVRANISGFVSRSAGCGCATIGCKRQSGGIVGGGEEKRLLRNVLLVLKI